MTYGMNSCSTEDVVGRILPIDELETRSRCLDHMQSVLSRASRISVNPLLAACATRVIAVRYQRSARSARSSVRQSFTARSAAKAGDDGGGDSDPERRTYHRNTQQHLLSNAVSALTGGVK